MNCLSQRCFLRISISNWLIKKVIRPGGVDLAAQTRVRWPLPGRAGLPESLVGVAGHRPRGRHEPLEVKDQSARQQAEYRPSHAAETDVVYGRASASRHRYNSRNLICRPKLSFV